MLKDIDPNTPAKYLSHVGSLELNTVRPGFQEAYGVINRLQKVHD